MKVYQLDNDPKRIYFTNYDRLDEDVIFQQIYSMLKKGKDIAVGEKQIGPSEDFYKCQIGYLPFILYYDIDYGTSIHAERKETIRKLIEYFENN